MAALFLGAVSWGEAEPVSVPIFVQLVALTAITLLYQPCPPVMLKPGGRVAVSDIVTKGDFTDELRADTERWADKAVIVPAVFVPGLCR